MLSPVVSRLFPIQGRPSGHWSRCWLHGTHVRPWFAQLRCRGAACEGGADASPRVDWCAMLATHRTLISARTDVLVARASCCCCSWCCMLPSAHSPSRRRRPRHQQQALIAARGRLPFARPFDFLQKLFGSRCAVTSRTRHNDAILAATLCASVSWSLHLSRE